MMLQNAESSISITPEQRKSVQRLAGHLHPRSADQTAVDRVAKFDGAEPAARVHVDDGGEPGVEIALIVDKEKPGWTNMLWKIHSVYLPGAVTLVKEAADKTAAPSPLLEARNLVDGQSTAYICRNYTCDKPITDIETLSAKMHEVAES